MAIRRQGFQWEVADLGNIPPKQLDLLEKTPQSVFYSKIGTATIKNRLRTKANEFVVLQYFGSTPGLWGVGNNWVPGGYVNFVVGTTSYFLDPDGRPAVGLSGTAAPYSITLADQPMDPAGWQIEIPPGTDWDITYFIANALVEPIEDFPTGARVSWTATS
ncbi:hypothetical protein N9M17_00140 [bacterium]|jgi:hypothetical protein|nr:hypothetical protein [bacterium]MDB4741172.1 hypothetical protein [Akkermansiaceae bacterium]